MNPSDVIKRTFIFDDLDEQDLLNVLRITKERHFSKDEVIMQEGQEGDSMYIIVDGSVEVSKTLTMKTGEDDFAEREKILTSLGSADNVVFGEIAMIDREKRSASVIATSDCVFLEIEREDFLKLIEQRPQMGVTVLKKIAELLASRLRQSSQDVIRLTTALSIALSSS